MKTNQRQLDLFWEAAHLIQWSDLSKAQQQEIGFLLPQLLLACLDVDDSPDDTTRQQAPAADSPETH